MNAPNISATNLNGNIVLFSEDTNGASGTSKIIISSAKPSMIFEYTTENCGKLKTKFICVVAFSLCRCIRGGRGLWLF